MAPRLWLDPKMTKARKIPFALSAGKVRKKKLNFFKNCHTQCIDDKHVQIEREYKHWLSTAKNV